MVVIVTWGFVLAKIPDVIALVEISQKWDVNFGFAF